MINYWFSVGSTGRWLCQQEHAGNEESDWYDLWRQGYRDCRREQRLERQTTDYLLGVRHACSRMDDSCYLCVDPEPGKFDCVFFFGHRHFYQLEIICSWSPITTQMLKLRKSSTRSTGLSRPYPILMVTNILGQMLVFYRDRYLMRIWLIFNFFKLRIVCGARIAPSVRDRSCASERTRTVTLTIISVVLELRVILALSSTMVRSHFPRRSRVLCAICSSSITVGLKHLYPFTLSHSFGWRLTDTKQDIRRNIKKWYWQKKIIN